MDSKGLGCKLPSAWVSVQQTFVGMTWDRDVWILRVLFLVVITWAESTSLDVLSRLIAQYSRIAHNKSKAQTLYQPKDNRDCLPCIPMRVRVRMYVSDYSANFLGDGNVSQTTWLAYHAFIKRKFTITATKSCRQCIRLFWFNVYGNRVWYERIAPNPVFGRCLDPRGNYA